MLNILIRTSSRPNYFKKCIESINAQNANYNIIVGSDDVTDFYCNSYNLVRYKKLFIDETKNIELDFDKIRHFPFNTYFNRMYSKVKTGYVMFLDDDDCFNTPDAIKTILQNVTENTALFWKVNCGGQLIPDEFTSRPVERNISGIGFCFHSKWLPLLQWDEYKRGDYRLACRIHDLMNVKKIDQVLTRTQDVQHGGNAIDKDSKTIAMLIPLWKRPEIVKQFVKSLKRIKEVDGITLKPVFILSKEDPFYYELLNLLSNYKVISYNNNPLGRKMNAGIRWILDNMKFDYLMNIGSDDILNPNILQIYKPYMSEKYFGIDNFYIYDGERCAKFKYELLVGGARMIHRSIIERCIDIYPDDQNSGLDTASNAIIEKHTGLRALKIKTEPLVLDLKTATNINSMDILMYSDLTEDVDFNKIKKYFYE